jgi:hypothetical protein
MENVRTREKPAGQNSSVKTHPMPLSITEPVARSMRSVD